MISEKKYYFMHGLSLYLELGKEQLSVSCGHCYFIYLFNVHVDKSKKYQNFPYWSAIIVYENSKQAAILL
jgi:hypothetical protein